MLKPVWRAAFFVVLHVSPHRESVLPRLLARAGRLPAVRATDNQIIEYGRIYVAPPDYHMLLEGDRIRLSHGPKENRHRPAIDPLFRTAARQYGLRVIGIVLSGGLDDGSMGLKEIKDGGGLTMVQDPDEALYPDMPRNAEIAAKPHHCMTISEMEPILDVELRRMKEDAMPRRSRDKGM